MCSDTVRFTRGNLPAEFADTNSWPQIETSRLSEDQRVWVEKRQTAIRSYLQNKNLTIVCAELGLSRHEVLRQFNKCVSPHDDGRIFGWRALVRHKHSKSYQRNKSLQAGSGYAGAFQQFLNQYPKVREQIDEAIDKQKIPDALQEATFSIGALSGFFRRSCIRAGVSENSYPLNTDNRGSRSLRRYLQQQLKKRFSIQAQRLGGQRAKTMSRVGTGHPKHQIAGAPNDVLSVDAHTIGLIGTIEIEDRHGKIYVPLSRFQFIVALAEEGNCVVGYTIAISRSANSNDVVNTIQQALAIWEPRKINLAGFDYPPGAMLPSAMGEEFVGLCWSVLMLDNASIHFSKVLMEKVRKDLGFAINWGPVRQWSRRALIEALFSGLARRGFHRLPNTMGSGPADPLRPDAVNNAVNLQITYQELLDLIDVLVCTYNATPQDALDGFSPLEWMQNAMCNAKYTWLPRKLPDACSTISNLDVEIIRKTIRGNVAKGRRPHINYECTHYTSPLLANASDLIGKQIDIHVRRKDLRVVRAFLPTGEELGELVAGGRWSGTPHDRKLRKSVMKDIEAGVFRVPPGTDVIQAWLHFKKVATAKQARENKGRPRISRDATELARASQVSGTPISDVSAPSANLGSVPRVPKAPPPAQAPSFVPTIKHKGHTK